jgi:hypothetical protein
MPYNFFAPKPGRFGVLPTIMNSGRLNTGTLAAGTQTHNIGGYSTKSYISKAAVCAETYPTAATSCRIELYKMTGATALALTATGASALSINTQAADTPIQIPILSTLTDAQRTLQPGDSLRISIVTVGAVSVQPEDVTVSVELFVEE